MGPHDLGPLAQAREIERLTRENNRLRDDLSSALAMLMRLTAIAGDADERFFGEPPKAKAAPGAAEPSN